MDQDQVKIGIIGGTGVGQALGLGIQDAHRHEVQTPFGPPSDAILETRFSGMPVFILARHGPGHRLGPSQVPYRANIFALKQLGVTHIIASGAVGSLREEFGPRDLVIPDQMIDKTHRRPSTFYENAAVHVDFSEPFCPRLRGILLEEGQKFRESPGDAAPDAAPVEPAKADAPATPAEPTEKTGAATPAEPAKPAEPPFAVHGRGCYVCMEGPAFSTRAESLMHRLWGGDLIGMTAMPEAKLAREAEIAYALVALVTDYDCWRQKPAAVTKLPGNTPEPALEMDADALLKEILANLRAATDHSMRLISRAIERIAADPSQVSDSPARQALRLAIWSEKSAIAPEERQRLAPLWGRWFAG